MTLNEAVDKFNELGADAVLIIRYGVEGWSGKASWWDGNALGVNTAVDVPFTDDLWNESAEALLEELYRLAVVAEGHG